MSIYDVHNILLESINFFGHKDINKIIYTIKEP